MRSRRRLHHLVASLAVSALTGALVAGTAAIGHAQDDEVTVRIRLFSFEPARLDIATGTTVTWLNDELSDYPGLDGTHRVVAEDGSFDSQPLQPGQRFSRTFLEPATLQLVCRIHPLLMSGELRVTGPPVEPEPSRRDVVIVEPSNDPDSWGYRPDDLTVDAGTTVVWRNNGVQVHTVTAADGSFDSGELAPGETFEIVLDQPAAIRYACTPHPWMTGLLRVAGGGRPPPPPPRDRPRPPPPPSVDQPERAGDQPATFSVLAVEPDAAQPTGWGFQPAALTVRTGDTIVWRNAGASIHTVTAADGSFDSGDLAAGETFRRRFTEPATIRYACRPHPWMQGTILVVAAGEAGEPPPPPLPPDTSPRGGSPGEDRAPADEEGPTTTDRAAAARAPLAIGTAGLALLLGLMLVVPSLVQRTRRRAAGAGPPLGEADGAGPAAEPPDPEAEPSESVGAARGEPAGAGRART